MDKGTDLDLIVPTAEKMVEGIDVDKVAKSMSLLGLGIDEIRDKAKYLGLDLEKVEDSISLLSTTGTKGLSKLKEAFQGLFRRYLSGNYLFFNTLIIPYIYGKA